ncbi:MAG: ribonuclease R, partial [Deltaproteobacteria bacterium]|nr:ribonuclease R [Deltaproteobacteria bacterium]
MPSSPRDEVATEELLRILEGASPRSLTVREIATRLELERWDPRAMAKQLEEQVQKGPLQRVGKTRWRYATEVVEKRARKTSSRRAPNEIVGRFVRVRTGIGFVTPSGEAAEALGGDVLIPRGREGHALHGDRVRVQIARFDARSRRASGRVVGVVERATERLLGKLELLEGARWRSIPAGWRLVPFSDRMPFVEVSETAGGEPLRREHAGRTALVRLSRPPVGAGPWRGEVERFLGDASDPEVQFLQIVLEHGLRLEFPPAVLAEAERLPVDPKPADVRGREDLRALPFVTIDGETARDFDDAVCLEPLPDDGVRLRVAIADVSHYVQPGSALDVEARLRGTSVYFPDRAIPMLPERLSNQLCSLNPDRDRAVVVAEMEYDRAGARGATRLYRGVIRSRARLTYTEVAAVLSETDDASVQRRRAELADLLPQLASMRILMRLLYRRRIANGSLDLDLPEALLDLSEEGRMIGIRIAERNDAHRLIEEFMLEANQVVALVLERAELPFPYRIHEPPEPDDVKEVNDLLTVAGTRIETGTEVRPEAVSRALAKLRGHPLERVLSRHVLRALKQARYSTENAGHFGLAFTCYCHFTSPIRRYPDLLVHRQVVRLLEGEGAQARTLGGDMAAASDESSQREREAMEAERAMVDLKKAEFMLGHMLEPEPATIVTVAPFGFFVELDAYPIEGLVRADELPGLWHFDERSHSLSGARSGRRFRLGDRVIVEASQVSLERRQVTFTLVETGAPARRAPAREAESVPDVEPELDVEPEPELGAAAALEQEPEPEPELELEPEPEIDDQELFEDYAHARDFESEEREAREAREARERVVDKPKGRRPERRRDGDREAPARGGKRGHWRESERSEGRGAKPSGGRR